MMMHAPRSTSTQLPRLRGQWSENVSMARHVSWRAGGVARRAYQPADSEDLALFLADTPLSEPLLVAGLGSNLLVRDGGFKGTVVLLHAALNRLESFTVEALPMIYAEAGVASPKLARFAANHHQNAAFLAGVPGTVGGALAMNAGCYGSETWSFVQQVVTLDRHGERHIRTPHEYEIGYRHVVPKVAAQASEIFVGACFRFPEVAPDTARLAIKTLLEKRVASQPLRWPNAGSVFRNPPGDFAARLIEQAGLKGLNHGGATVSTQHANFIINPQGQATATDIEQLIQIIRDRVLAASGIQLVPEVRIVGDALPAFQISGS